jgi:hypothetical protein
MLGTNAQYTGFKNRLINSAMVIDQRNAGASSVPATGSYTYTSLDRYFTSVNTPATSTAIQSTTVPTGFLYSLKIGRSGTGTAGLNTFGQVIETNNSQDLASSAVTLSFWAKVGASATFSTMSANIYSGTVANQTAATLRSGWTGQATVATNSSIALTTTWQQFSITGSVGSTALQLAVQFIFTTVGTAGADDNLYITGVQLEKGSTATSFDYRPYGTELQLCQRYYERSYDIGTATATVTNAGANWSYINFATGSANDFSTQVTFQSSKRAIPTMTVYSPDTGASGNIGSAGGDKAATASFIGMHGCTIYGNLAGQTNAQCRAHWLASSEL